MEKPQFGEMIINPHASMNNPTREGYFVREVRRTGFTNPGVYWEFTDKEGKFWQIAKESFREEPL